MKTIFSPYRPVGLVLFFVLSMSPAILHLLSVTIPLTNPWLALGPPAAGVAFALRFSATPTAFGLLSVVITFLIWTTNWIMASGGNCCSFH